MSVGPAIDNGFQRGTPVVMQTAAVAVLAVLTLVSAARAEGPVDALVAFARAVEAGDVDAAEAALDPEAEHARATVRAAAPLIEASAELIVAVEAKFDVRIASLFASGLPNADDLAELTEVQVDGDRAALSVSLRDGVFETSATTDTPEEMSAVRRDGRWYLDPTPGDLPPELAALMLEMTKTQAGPLAAGIRKVAARVVAGEFADLTDVEFAVGDAVDTAFSPAE